MVCLPWQQCFWEYLVQTASSSAAHMWDTGRCSSSHLPGCSRVCRSSQNCLQDNRLTDQYSIQAGRIHQLTLCKHSLSAWAVGWDTLICISGHLLRISSTVCTPSMLVSEMVWKPAFKAALKAVATVPDSFHSTAHEHTGTLESGDKLRHHNKGYYIPGRKERKILPAVWFLYIQLQIKQEFQ